MAREWDFILSLSIEFKEPNPDALLDTLSCRNYFRWKRHFAKRGFSEDLANWRAARLCMVIERAPHYTPPSDRQLSDFYPIPPKPREKTVEEIMALMSCVAGVTRE